MHVKKIHDAPASHLLGSLPAVSLTSVGAAGWRAAAGDSVTAPSPADQWLNLCREKESRVSSNQQARSDNTPRIPYLIAFQPL